MMKKGRQKKYFRAIGKSMLRHLRAFFETKKPEELHRFRVQVKKLNALLLLLPERSKEDDYAKHLKKLRSTYKHAGEIRKAHINIGLLEQYPMDNPLFKHALENKVKRETEQFCLKRNAGIKNVKWICKTMAVAFPAVKDSVVLNLFQRRLKKLVRLFEKSRESIEQLHNVRKEIKKLLYLNQMLPGSLAEKLHLNAEYLDQLQDTIGKWHDVESVTELLKREGLTKGSAITTLHRQRRKLHRAVLVSSEDFAKKVVSEDDQHFSRD
ncbi:MAG: CHAD domain-containing protein [Saprospiraceae bacterium]|nr:CHAD domain-containing protein [Saprospiraceae bacterium]